MERRKLGYLEALCASLCETGNNTSTVVSTCDLEGELDQEIMVGAIEVMFDKHPMLRCTIVKEEGDWFLEESAQFENVAIEFLSYKKGIQKIVDREMTHQIDPSKAMWRLSILIDDRKRKVKNHSLVLTTHHSIVDGDSACIFFQDLMKMYEKLEENPNFRPDSLPFLDNIEELLDTNKSFEEYLDEKKEITSFQFDHQKFEKDVPLEKRTTRSKYINFGPEQLQAIVRSAKEHRLTVNHILSSAMLLAYADFMGKKVKVPLIIPIAMRDKAIPKIGFEHFGVFVGFLQVNFSVDPKVDPFELAASFKEQFDIEVETQAYKPHPLEMKTDELIEKFQDFQPASSDAFPMGLLLSNLTRFPLNPNLKRHKLKTLHFTACRNGADIPFVIHAITLSNTLYTSTAWPYPAISDEKGEQFCQCFIKRLETMCGFSHGE